MGQPVTINLNVSIENYYEGSRLSGVAPDSDDDGRPVAHRFAEVGEWVIYSHRDGGLAVGRIVSEADSMGARSYRVTQGFGSAAPIPECDIQAILNAETVR